MNKKILVGIIIVVLVFVGLGFFWDLDGERQIKQGVLTSVEYISGTSYVLTFSDGVELTFKEDNAEDAQEMYECLVEWVNQEIVIEYTYEFWNAGYFLNSYSSVD